MRAQVQFWLERHPLAGPVATLATVGGGSVYLAPSAWWSLHATILGVGLAIVLALHLQQRYGRHGLGEALDALRAATADMQGELSRVSALGAGLATLRGLIDAETRERERLDRRVASLEETLRSVRGSR